MGVEMGLEMGLEMGIEMGWVHGDWQIARLDEMGSLALHVMRSVAQRTRLFSTTHQTHRPQFANPMTQPTRPCQEPEHAQLERSTGYIPNMATACSSTRLELPREKQAVATFSLKLQVQSRPAFSLCAMLYISWCCLWQEFPSRCRLT